MALRRHIHTGLQPRLYVSFLFICSEAAPPDVLFLVVVRWGSGSFLGEAAALTSVFSPSLSRSPLDGCSPFDQVLGEALRRSWQPGLAGVAEQMLRMRGWTCAGRGTQSGLPAREGAPGKSESGRSRVRVLWGGLQICGSLLLFWFAQQLDPLIMAPAVLLPLKRFSSHKL